MKCLIKLTFGFLFVDGKFLINLFFTRAIPGHPASSDNKIDYINDNRDDYNDVSEVDVLLSCALSPSSQK